MFFFCCRNWDFVNQMHRNQHNEIQIYFGQRIIVLKHRFKGNILYSQWVGNISRTRLNFIFHEAKRENKTHSDSSKCGCTLRKMYDLPCACLTAKKMSTHRYVWMRFTLTRKDFGLMMMMMV